MAVLTLPEEGRRIENSQEIAAYLKPYGITYEFWEVAGRLGKDASDEEILEAYRPEIERMKTEGGYITADVINVTCETPNLQALLDKFNKEHTHSEDEVRFVVKGRGVFHIHGESEGAGEKIMAVQVEAGDLLNVPRDTKHWFDLCEDRQIRCIRLFQEASGWTPHYIEGGVHEKYQPLCWGPETFPVEGASGGSTIPKLEV